MCSEFPYEFIIQGMSMKIINGGSKISQDDINDIQEKIGVLFPEDYRKFLLQSNGGETEEDMLYDFFDEVTENNNTSVIQEFFSIDGERMDIYTVYKNLLDEEAIPRDMIAIASDPGGNIISISLAREDYGTVYFLNHEYEEMDSSYLVKSKIASSFTEFISQLYQDE